MRRPVAFVLLATVLVVLSFVSAAYADPNNNNSAKLRSAVTLEGVRAHQLALQQIATANGGNRFAGLPGHDKSVDYVVDTLEAAGYDPVVQPFDELSHSPWRSGLLPPAAAALADHERCRETIRRGRVDAVERRTEEPARRRRADYAIAPPLDALGRPRPSRAR